RPGCMAALLHALGRVCYIVLARPLFPDLSWQPHHHGMRRTAWHRRVAPLPAMALAFWVQPEVLRAAGLLWLALRGCLHNSVLWPGDPAPRKRCAGLLDRTCSTPAVSARNLVLCDIPRHSPSRADAQPPAREGDTHGARRGAGHRCAPGRP